ncbi:MAG: glycine--tRNA ligase subunit beta [Gammaproteobacteria bacterium]|nr:glycine--tRNA ligase subunit beta [Gammaproteobacteria bacterium]
MDSLLIELGCEDLPAGSLQPLSEHLGTGLSRVLSEAGLCNKSAEVFATPRRIGARISAVEVKQEDREVERKGPSMQAAFKDGEPTKALSGFLKSAGASVDDVQTVSTPKGDWVIVKQLQTGKTLTEVLSDALPEILKTMPIPKRMKWADLPHEFLRPVQWLLAIHGSEVLPLEAFGLKASNLTYGHRFHSPSAVKISHPQEYETTLERAFVIADFPTRRTIIRTQVAELAKTAQAAPVVDDELLDEVTALVEWPVAVTGNFDANYLEIPKEALIQTMQENQRYFALLDQQGALLPAFITVSNVDSKRMETVIDGNERVIRPRFADTMFFWQQDKSKTLADHIPQLSSLLFQEKLGSVGDKVDRLQLLSAELASPFGASGAECELAASLCKCDLNTEIVKELAKMQGIAGRYYALRDGHNEAISAAMEEHYFPKQAGGDLPTGAVGQVVALADKTDTLVGIYGLGLKPTGAKDPFGLRRASLGIIRLIVETHTDIDLNVLFKASISSYGDKLSKVDQHGMMAYVMERLRGYAIERGYAADVVDAVLVKNSSSPLDIFARLDAMTQFRRGDAAIVLSAASKRIGNILKKNSDDIGETVNPSLLTESAEKALHEVLTKLKPGIEKDLDDRDYAAAMNSTAEFKQPVDDFFDGVMVLDENSDVRRNRLALLAEVGNLCSYTADLSRLQAESDS